MFSSSIFRRAGSMSVRRINSNVQLHKQRLELKQTDRIVFESATFIAPNASISGHAAIYSDSVIMYGVVIRADKSPILVKHGSYIGDRTVLNTVPSADAGFAPKLVVGVDSYVGPNCVLTSCEVGNRVNIGAGSVIQEGTIIGPFAIVAPGSNVLPGSYIKEREYWAGNPAKFIREVVDEEIKMTENALQIAAAAAELIRAEYFDTNHAYLDAERKGLLE